VEIAKLWPHCAASPLFISAERINSSSSPGSRAATPRHQPFARCQRTLDLASGIRHLASFAQFHIRFTLFFLFFPCTVIYLSSLRFSSSLFPFTLLSSWSNNILQPSIDLILFLIWASYPRRIEKNGRCDSLAGAPSAAVGMDQGDSSSHLAGPLPRTDSIRARCCKYKH
jgi:hypothetical protein